MPWTRRSRRATAQRSNDRFGDLVPEDKCLIGGRDLVLLPSDRVPAALERRPHDHRGARCGRLPRRRKRWMKWAACTSIEYRTGYVDLASRRGGPLAATRIKGPAVNRVARPATEQSREAGCRDLFGGVGPPPLKEWRPPATCTPGSRRRRLAPLGSSAGRQPSFDVGRLPEPTAMRVFSALRATLARGRRRWTHAPGEDAGLLCRGGPLPAVVDRRELRRGEHGGVREAIAAERVA